MGVSASCCCGTEDLLSLAPYQHAGSLLDPKSHRCESGVCPLGSPRRETGPVWPLAGLPGTRSAPSAGASLEEPELGGTEGRRLVQAQKAPFWVRSRVPGASSSLSPWVTLPWVVAEVRSRAVFGGSCLGCCRGQEGRSSCALWLLPPPSLPSLFIDSASYSAETNLFQSGPGASGSLHYLTGSHTLGSTISMGASAAQHKQPGVCRLQEEGVCLGKVMVPRARVVTRGPP